MSVEISKNKIAIFYIILLISSLFILEISVRTVEFLEKWDCNFINNIIFDEFSFFEKKFMCYEYNALEYNKTNSIQTLKPIIGEYVNINSNGFRDHTISDITSKDYVIYFIGGSTTFGSVTSSDHMTIPALLEKQFAKNGLHVKVINAGIPGSSTYDELFYVENYITKLDPNLIILYDGANDMKLMPPDNYSYEEFKEKTYYENHSFTTSKSGISSFLLFIDYKSAYFILDKIKELRNINQMDVKNSNIINDDKLLNTIEKRMDKNWSAIYSLGKNNGFKTVFFVQPILGTSDRNFPESKTLMSNTNSLLNELTLEKFADDLDIVDLRNSFEGYDDIHVYWDSVHMSDFGNKIISKKIYEKIIPIVIKDIKK